MRKNRILLLVFLLVTGMLVVACGGNEGNNGGDNAANNAANNEAAANNTDDEAAADNEAAADDEAAMDEEVVTIRWFVGLGTGGNPNQIEAQEAVVEEFNSTHDNIQIELEIVQNEQATDILSTQIAAGDPPDIVGPVGVGGSIAFAGLFLNIEPLINSTGYDVGQFDPAQVEFWRTENGLEALPFGVFPSMIFYNRDLFDEAGLEYPPHEWGAPYADGDDWDIDKLTELAMQLTVDANGNDANSPDFDPENIVQFGYLTQWTDPRGQASLFGAGEFVDADGNAQMPDHWRDYFHWQYEAMWNSWFWPNGIYQGSDLLGAGNPFNSGNMAMAHVHMWYATCCTADISNWDLAAIPSYNGEITAKLHADTFRIMAGTEHPEEAFEVLTYLVGEAAPDLLQVYGAMPARPELMDAFFAGLDEANPQGIDWQVAIDSLAYPDIPNHEDWMPNYNAATDRVGAFQSLYENTPDLDLDAELDTLVSDLQVVFESD